MAQYRKQDLIDYINFAKKIALDAGKIMKKNNNWNKQIPKGFDYINEYVADLIEKYIDKKIKRSFPRHSLFKVKGRANTGEFEWICDYVDGAYCYSKGHKISVTSVALTHKGKTIVSVIYNPWTDTMYSAYINGGFFVNNKKQPKVNMKSFHRSLVNVEWWKNADYDVDTWMHNFSINKNVYVLHIGSIINAACLVANGIFSAAVLGKFISGKNHEIAAISLIIQESGCLLTDLKGNNITHVDNIEGLIFANRSIHKTLIKDYAKFSNK